MRRAQLDLKTRTSVALACMVGRLLALLPGAVRWRLVDLTGDIAYLLLPTYRRNVRSNLRRAFGPDASARQLTRATREVFRNSARNFYDLLRVPFVPLDRLAESVVMSPESSRYIRELTQSERGCLIVTGHFGAFDYVGQIFCAWGHPVTTLTTRTVPEFLFNAVTHLRASRGVNVLEATPGGVRRALKALRRGEIVGLIADRDFFQSGVPVTFFGEETTLPPGPIRIARDAGVPIGVAFTRRLRDRFEVIVERPFMVERGADPEADVRRGLDRLVRIIERHIRAAPDQWVIFQQVWPERPPAALRVFPIGSPLEGQVLGPRHQNVDPLTVDPAGQPASRLDAPRPSTGPPEGQRRPDHRASEMGRG